MDDALCGGSSAAGGNTQAPRVADMLDSRIAAVIMMGNPRHADGLSYNVGTAEADGVRFPTNLLPHFYTSKLISSYTLERSNPLT